MDRLPVGDVEDLATLASLDENILLEEIAKRYQQNKIYTYVGDILLAVNPFVHLGIYGKTDSQRYKNIKKSSHPPHIYAVADATYQALLGRGGKPPGNQCILISGESGAGKTESTKFIIKQLVELCRGNTQLEQQILQVNPLLEAFGNAQTNLNDNSSRFGKYIQLRFNHGQLASGKISEYLLEKSRVVRQNPGEKNFHIFYYLFSSKMNKKLNLGSCNSYRYLLNQLQKNSVSEHSDAYKLETLINAMDLVGFTDSEQEDMFSVIASVLHLGNIDFSVQEDDSVSLSDRDGSFKTAANLLGLEAIDFEKCLTCMTNVTNGETVKRNYSKQTAEDVRDAIAKTVYGRLFGWIVNKINCLLLPDDQRDPLGSEIGILDIFGFEDFTKNEGSNSFEQACINLANEQLQFFFNQHIFYMEQEEYRKEEIDWSEIGFVDNKPLLDLFLAKPIGLLSLLDEESLFPKGTDQSFVAKLNIAFGGNQYYVKSQQTNIAKFSIQHYAGKVLYTADQWLEKNRDTLPPGTIDLMQSSVNTLIKTIFKGQISRTGSLALQGRRAFSKNLKVKANHDTAKRSPTVSAQFKNSLNILMERMTAASPVFVRCLKPNHLKQPGVLDREFIHAQLLYTGMLGTVEIRRKGFAIRPTFAHFIEKYKVLLDINLPPTAQSCSALLNYTKCHGCVIGKTKVFLKHHHIEHLNELMDKLTQLVIIAQRVARGYIARKIVKKWKELLKQIEQQKHEAEEKLAKQRAEEESRWKKSLEDAAQNGESGANTLINYIEPSPPWIEDEVLEDVPTQESSNSSKFGRPGTKRATSKWFRTTQRLNVMHEQSGQFAEWFHGIITRQEAEKLLQNKILGCFLIRVSERRFGYTLTFRDETRCRNYMIDQLKNGKFIIIGEPKVHRNLHDLVVYHKKHKLSNWGHLLTVPCGQESGECDYSELVVDQKNRRPLPKVPEDVYRMMIKNSRSPMLPRRVLAK
ncbi:unconventional myosin-VIIa-like isoform X2 [Physella acuta]|nr:unconventional myosin-VIIa-like isoform X2 [Physella acuta]XP_059159221.1 unconventional myosin-VIIa-like isoform X2 [Physella acuta]